MNNIFEHLNIFYDRLNEIENFIKFVELQKKFVREYNNINSKNTKKKINKSCCIKEFHELNQILINSTVEYNAVIISIYGCFENFIDDIAKEFLIQSTNGIKKFNSLPHNIRDNYLKNVGDFLTNPQRFSNIGLDSNNVINRLSQNISDDNDIELQYEFILRHKSNMKIDEIANLFRNINITDIKNKLKNNIHIRDYLVNKEERTLIEVVSLLSQNTINPFYILDELVDERNSIAHSWRVSSRLSYTAINENIIPYIKVLCLAITETLILESYKLLFDKGYMSQYDNPIKVIRSKILCINSKNSILRVDQYLFYKINDNNYQIARIKSIELDNCKFTEFIHENTDIGIELDRNIKKDYCYFYISQLHTVD